MEDHKHVNSTSAHLMRQHYVMFAVNMAVSFVIMYLVMFSMIWSAGEFVQNLNFFYMALTMATPMGILMLLTMGSMFTNKRLNLILHATLALTFVLALAAIRMQTLVGDRQFVRSMIPHHSGAILMCERASLRDAEIRELCFSPTGIVESQRREIAQMHAILSRR